MDLDQIEERSSSDRQASERTAVRRWVIPVSLLFHIFLMAIFYVQWPKIELEAASEQTVSLEIIPEEEQPELPAKEEDNASVEEATPDAAAEEEPKPAEAAAAPNILPDIAIRPEETRLDNVDGEEASSPEDAKPADVPESAARPPETETEPSEEEQGFGEATSLDGELPAGENAPLPMAKPTEPNVEPAMEEREPLSNDVIAQTGLRHIMGDLPPRRRLIQICTIEAISQIRASAPQYAGVQGVVPSSDEGLKIDGGKMTGRGGAFNVRGNWVALDFDCEADLERFRVIRFSQKIGDALTSHEVKARGYERFQ